MSIKSIFDKGDKKHRTCLKCGGAISLDVRLKDDTVYTCPNCGQAHFVDVFGSRVTLTKEEYAEYRRRPDPKDLSGKIERLEKELEKARAEAQEWQQAAEGLARYVEQLTAQQGQKTE